MSTRTFRLILGAAVWAAACGLVSAQGAVKLGPEFRVNSYTTGFQVAPRVAADGTNGFVVVWQSKGQDGSLTGVYAQRYNNAGATVGGEFRVNTYTTSYQSYPAVASDSAGNFVVSWGSYGQGGAYSYYNVFSQRYTSAGATVGSTFQINAYTSYDQATPRVARNGSGFTVVWSSDQQDASGNAVYGRRYNSAGSALASEFRINSYTTGEQAYPDVGLDGTNNFVVVWQSYLQDGAANGVYGQRYNSAGTKVGAEFRVNSTTTGSQYGPAVAVAPAGGFVVTWTSPQDGNLAGVVLQRYDNAGVKLGAEFQVNSYTTLTQKASSIAVSSTGDFVIVWQSNGQDGSGYGIFGQRYTSTGAPRGNEFPINTFTTNAQTSPAVTMDPAGNFTVVWESVGQDGSVTGVFGQRFSNADCTNLSTTPPSNAMSCTGGTAMFSITASGTGLTYQWRRNGTPLAEGAPYTGTNTPNLTVNPVSFALTGSFSCLVKDGCAPTGSSVAGPATLQLNDPGVVPGLIVSRTPTTIHFGWQAATNATGYTVYEDSSPTGTFATPTGTASSGVTGVSIPTPAGNMFYLVASNNVCGEGPKR